MGTKNCVGCGKEIKKGYYIVDEFSGGEGWLCPDCFDYMCLNRVRDRVEGVLTISQSELRFEVRLKPYIDSEIKNTSTQRG